MARGTRLRHSALVEQRPDTPCVDRLLTEAVSAAHCLCKGRIQSSHGPPRTDEAPRGQSPASTTPYGSAKSTRNSVASSTIAVADLERMCILGCQVQRIRECSRKEHRTNGSATEGSSSSTLLASERPRIAPNLMPKHELLVGGSYGLSEVEIASWRDVELLKQIAAQRPRVQARPPPSASPTSQAAAASRSSPWPRPARTEQGHRLLAGRYVRRARPTRNARYRTAVGTSPSARAARSASA